MAVLGADGVSVVAGVIVVARLGGVPHRGVPIVVRVAGVARAVLIAAHGLRRGRLAVQAVVIAGAARREVRVHVPAQSRASGRLRRVGQERRPQPIEARLRPGVQRAASNDR